MFVKQTLVCGVLMVSGLTVAGCGMSPEKSPTVAAPTKATASEGHSHDGWWCDEHGVPEDVCAQCNAKLVADFKSKGDWCKEHERPESQCFICHPEKEDEFAARYEAKYGKKPPKPHESDEHEHHGDDEKS
jgi:cobalt-zinc-cadmium efflux system membrane fusion protein